MGWRPRARHWWAAGIVISVIVASLAVAALRGEKPDLRGVAASPSPAASTPAPSPSPSVPAAAKPPKDLPVIAYLKPLPRGFPVDPTPQSTALVSKVLRPNRTLAVYDAPGGRPRAYLPRVISGALVALPIIKEESGWTAVLMPSANRTLGWLPPAGWSTAVTLDQLILHRKAHRLEWTRGGVPEGSWKVSIGAPSEPTPLGRTFVFGRSTLPGEVYAGLDVLALGAVPDDPDAVPAGLRGAHIGIHSWYQNTFGGNSSDGCVHVPPEGQKALLKALIPGTGVVVLP